MTLAENDRKQRFTGCLSWRRVSVEMGTYKCLSVSANCVSAKEKPLFGETKRDEAIGQVRTGDINSAEVLIARLSYLVQTKEHFAAPKNNDRRRPHRGRIERMRSAGGMRFSGNKN